MTQVVKGFNDVETWVSDVGYVCIKQFDDLLGQYITLMFPVSAWASVKENIEKELLEWDGPHES